MYAQTDRPIVRAFRAGRPAGSAPEYDSSEAGERSAMAEASGNYTRQGRIRIAHLTKGGREAPYFYSPS